MHRQAEFIEEFNSLPTWTDRYQYLCDLGSEMPIMSEHLKVPDNRLMGCQSTLFFHVSTNPVIRIQAWGNSPVSFGLAALLAKLFNSLTPNQFRQVDITFHTATGLLDNLSLTRRQGLLEMIRILKNHTC